MNWYIGTFIFDSHYTYIVSGGGGRTWILIGLSFCMYFDVLVVICYMLGFKKVLWSVLSVIQWEH